LLNYLDQDLANGWRWSLGLQTLMGGVTALGLCFVNETPRFLQSVGRCEEAVRVLCALRGGREDVARTELKLVQEELEVEAAAGSATWGEVCSNPFFRNVVLIGCSVQFFQIITGINAMVSYGGTLFGRLGVRGIVTALIPPTSFAIGNAIGSFFLADRAGRRKLLIWGMVAMSFTLTTAGIVNLAANRTVDEKGIEHINKQAGYVIIAMVVGYMFAFGISWGFGAWLYVSEIMPLRVRGKAVGLATGVNWGPANVLSAFGTPMMIQGSMGPGGTLLFFGIVSALVVPFVLTCIPETKGRTLEQITPLFHFKDCRGFSRFVRGNLRGGHGTTQGRPGGYTVGSDADTEDSELSD